MKKFQKNFEKAIKATAVMGKPFTVVGFHFEDVEDSFIDHVKAANARDAREKAVKDRTDEGEVVIVAVFRGHLTEA